MSKNYSVKDFTILANWITKNKAPFVLSVLTRKPATKDFINSYEKENNWNILEKEWSLINVEQASLFEKWYQNLQNLKTYQGKKMEELSIIMKNSAFGNF